MAAVVSDTRQQQQENPAAQPQLADPTHRAYALRQEYAAAMAHPVPGLYPLPSAVDPLAWYGCLFVRHGPYRGHLVRFLLRVPADFPSPASACPALTLAPPVPLHPHVAPGTGAVDLARSGFPNWRPGVHRLWQLLHHLRRLLARLDLPQQQQQSELATDQFANPEAVRLYLEDRDAFRSRLADDADASLNPPDGCFGDAADSDDPAASLWRLASVDNALTDEDGEFDELRAAMLEEAGSRELADGWAAGLWRLLDSRRQRPLPRVPTWMDRGTMRILSGDYQ